MDHRGICKNETTKKTFQPLTTAKVAEEFDKVFYLLHSSLAGSVKLSKI